MLEQTVKLKNKDGRIIEIPKWPADFNDFSNRSIGFNSVEEKKEFFKKFYIME